MTLSEDMIRPGVATTAAPAVDDADSWLAERIDEVAGYDRKTAVQCADALVDAAELEQAGLEVLEALYFLAVAQPKVAERLEFSACEIGRRLAQQLENDGQPERAIAVLQRTTVDFPEARNVERELAGIMRRAGKVRELVDRYLERSHSLLKRGRTMEAIPWLQEVLLVDRSRRDVARLIRDLRYQDVEHAARAKRRTRQILLALVFTALVALVGLREVKLYQVYTAIEQPRAEDLESWQTRMASLEQFAADHPVWHRTFTVRRELADLRVEIRRLSESAIAVAQAQEEEAKRRVLHAERARSLGVAQAESGHLEAALTYFEEALTWSDADWPERAQVERDVTAIRKWLEGVE